MYQALSSHPVDWKFIFNHYQEMSVGDCTSPQVAEEEAHVGLIKL